MKPDFLLNASNSCVSSCHCLIPAGVFFLLLPFPLCSVLPARLPAGEPQASGVGLKAELLPFFIND